MSCALKCVEEEDLKAKTRSQKRNGGAKERVFPRLQRVCTFYMLTLDGREKADSLPGRTELTHKA